MRRTRLALLVGAVALIATAAAAAAGSGSGVRVARHGTGAYIGNNFNVMPRYVVAAEALSSSLIEIDMHPWTTCYPTYELLNGAKVKLTPEQAKKFAADHGWSIGIPKIALSSSGSFHKSETVPGSDGSHPTISGKVSGARITGTFTATGIISSGSYVCDNVSFSWSATFNPRAHPDPTIFRIHP